MLCINGINAATMAAFFGDNMKLKLLATKKTTGDIILTGLKPMVPLVLTADGPNVSEMYVQYSCKSGSDYAKLGGSQILGQSSTIRTHTNFIIPTADTVKLNVIGIVGGAVMYIFTGE